MITYFAKCVFKKYRPKIIVIQDGGSALTRACFFVLQQKFRVRFLQEAASYAFLLQGEPRSFWARVRAWFSGVRLLLFHSLEYPEIMIIGAGSQTIPFLEGDVYAYVADRGTFQKRGERLSRRALYIVNGDNFSDKDDDRVRTRVRVLTYGIRNPNVRVKGEEVRSIEKDGRQGLYMKLLYAETATPLFIANCSLNDAEAALSAAALGFALSLTPLPIARGLEEFGNSSIIPQS